MKTNNINKIVQCIIEDCKENNIKPYIIAFALSFGRAPNEKFDTPCLIVSIATEEEILDMKKDKELIWNQAEYENQDVAFECIDKYYCEINQKNFLVEHSYEFYIKLLVDAKKDILDYFHKNSSFKPLVYVQEITMDADAVININFNKKEIIKLKENKLC